MSLISLDGKSRTVLIVPLWNWNPEIWAIARLGLIVLIVPLWNWNTSSTPTCFLPRLVLIVPLWNWNSWYHLWRKRTASSNCTFMELKWFTSIDSRSRPSVLIVPLWNWNSIGVLTFWKPPPVLIVPLWNWNGNGKQWARTERFVLIVPLWNWNYTGIRGKAPEMGSSNCTFMELKCEDDARVDLGLHEF